MSLDDIPFSVYLHFMMNHLSIKDVGFLTMVNKNLMEIFNDNQIWKLIYMRTNELKITDNSIHIGPHSYYWASAPIKSLLKEYKECKPIYWGNYSTIWSKDSFYTGCCGNISNYVDSMANSVAGVDMNIEQISGQSVELQKEYYEKIKKIHFEENKKHGFNTKNLCINKKHYIQSTLENGEGLKNCKSYKIVTLKKMNTQEFKEKEKLKKKLDRKEITIKRLTHELTGVLKEKRKLKKEYDKSLRFCSKVDKLLQ
tara:strand:- start:1784 stop:2548 length:765 start_codon:yes stop_codon:yes gene_type:complete